MPSTQTGTDKAFASVVTARMIAGLSRFSAMSLTKLRSILMMSNGSERRCASDEKPVPKSSSASRTPWFLRLVTMFGKVDVGKQRAFGDFDHQPLGRETGVGQDLHDPLREPAIGKLEWRDVDPKS